MKPDIWIDGVFYSWDKACIHPLCHSLQRGSTVFESIDCKEAVNGRPAIFRLQDHMKRFETSASIIDMPLDYNLEQMCDAVVDTVRRSGMKACTIRPLAIYADPVMQVYPGKSKVSFIIGLFDAPPEPHHHKVNIGKLRKIDGSCMPVKAKVSANYIGPMIAKKEALDGGYDDTILLDRDGFVAEAASANIFMVEKGILYTAPGDTVLLGVTRDTIAVLAAKLGIELRMERFSPERLKNADEVILSSTGNEVSAIIKVDDTIIGNGEQGPVTKNLADLYREIVIGRNSEFQHWLTYV